MGEIDRTAYIHRAIVHGATVGDDCLIGMAAVVLNLELQERHRRGEFP